VTAKDLPDLLTTPEVAAILRLPKKTLENWRLKGTGPRYLRLGKHVLYDRADLRQFINDQKKAAAS
jgi:predicted DNA-binding transcriptional regulator AlpA